MNRSGSTADLDCTKWLREGGNEGFSSLSLSSEIEHFETVNNQEW